MHSRYSVKQHAGGGAPDIALAVRDVAELHFLAGEAGAAHAHLVVGRIEDEIKRHLEGVLDLLRVDQQLKTRAHEGHHRGDPKARHHHVIGQVTDDGHELRLKADLLVRLAQRRLRSRPRPPARCARRGS